MDVSRDLQHLVPEARVKALEAVRLCASMGVELLVTCTYRSPEEQARIPTFPHPGPDRAEGSGAGAPRLPVSG